MKTSMWIFGYGSLIWKIDFKYSKKVPGYIKGYQRRFWQGSEDHRGVPGKPGRVVTLVESTNEEDSVYGYAFHVDSDYLDHLDHREKGGYKKTKVMFNPVSYDKEIEQDPFELELYIGTENNPHYLGPTSITAISQQIALSEGPSGRNIDYLLELATALRTHFPNVVDEHVFALEKETIKLASQLGIDIQLHLAPDDVDKSASSVPEEME